MEPHYYEREALVGQNSSWGCRRGSNGRGCRWLFGHRKFGIIAPLNFAIISSGRTDGERGRARYSDFIDGSYPES